MRSIKEIWENKLKPFCKKENMILLVLAGILLLIISLPTGKGKGKNLSAGEAGLLDTEGVVSLAGGGEAVGGEKDGEGYTENGAFGDEKYRWELQSEVEELLGSIEGAGEVRVMITLRESEELIVEKDLEKDQKQTREGGVTEKSGSEIILEENTVQDGAKKPFVKKRIYPKVEGVLVAAEGVGRGRVRADLTEAVQALFGLEAHKVKVLKLSHKSSE